MTPRRLNNLALALVAQGRFDEAIENYYKAIQINPDYPDAQYNLGIALAAKGRSDEAIENYRNAIQINPNNCEALDNLGMVLTARGQFDEAIGDFRQAIQINSDRTRHLLSFGHDPWPIGPHPGSDGPIPGGLEIKSQPGRGVEQPGVGAGCQS